MPESVELVLAFARKYLLVRLVIPAEVCRSLAPVVRRRNNLTMSMRYLKPIILAIVISFLGCRDTPTAPIKQKVLFTGEVVFFSSDRDGNATNIYMMTTQGEILKQITHFQYGEYVATAISPDSAHLLFYQSADWLDIDVGTDIFIYDLKQDSILGPFAQGNPGNFTPYGNKFVFSNHTFTDNGGYESVYIYDLLQHSQTKLTADGNSCFSAQVSPDGKFICYESALVPPRDSLSLSQLHLMDIEGNYFKALTPQIPACYAKDGVFTPDGRSIIASYNNQTWCYDIVSIDIATDSISHVTNSASTGDLHFTSNYYKPTVTHDGTRIYFYSKTVDLRYPHPVNIHVVHPDGSQLANISNDNHWDSHPIVGAVTCYIEK
jgi:Tol biopolymer transport system component